MATFAIDLLSNQIFLFNGDFSGSGSTTTTYPEVSVFGDLPDASVNTGKIYVVRNGSGVYLINRHEGGLYYSNGSAWVRLGDIPSFFNSSNFEIYDGVDTTKGFKFITNDISTNTYRNLSVQNKDGVLAYLDDVTGDTTQNLFLKLDQTSSQSIINGYPIFDGLRFKTGTTNPSHSTGLLFYDQDKNAVSYYNENPDVTINLGQELVFPVQNTTGSLIPNGAVVTPTLSGITLADRHSKERSRLVAVVTSDIPDGGWGYVTRLGQVGGLDTSSFISGQIIYLGVDGEFVGDRPTDGDYVIIIGVVDVSHPTDGIITVDINVADQTVEATTVNGISRQIYNNTTLNIDETTRTFTFSGDSDVHYYYDGEKFEVSGNSNSIIFSDVEGRFWIYYDGNTLTEIINPTIEEVRDIILYKVPLCSFYWDSVNNKVLPDVLDERHGINMSSETNLYLKYVNGPKYISGFSIGSVTANSTGNLNTDAQYSITSGLFFAEDLEFAGGGKNVGDTISVFYLTGTSLLRSDSINGFAVLTGSTGRLAYNLNSGGVWSVANVPEKDYVLYHLFAINSFNSNKRLISVMGNRSYLSASDATSGAVNEIGFITSLFPTADLLPIASFIYQTADGYGNAVKARIRLTDDGKDYIDWTISNINAGNPPSSHNQLSDLFFAGSGVTWGHINSLSQILYGSKTFANTITVPDVISTGNTLVKSIRTKVTGSTYNPLVTDNIIGVVDTTGNTVTLQLPNISVIGNVYWQIKDEGFNAATNPITLSASTGNFIENGLTNVSINVDGGSVSIYNNGNNNWYII